MEEKNGMIKLRVVTPSGIAAEAECRSVRFNAKDGENGKGGGGIGIRKGHMKSLIAVEAGEIIAVTDDKLTSGKNDFRIKVKAGFAAVKDDVVTVITDAASINM